MGTRVTSTIDRPPDSLEINTTSSSNAVCLTLKQWLIVGILAMLMILFVPGLWRRLEKFEPGPDYRIPYELSADYWLYDRNARLAAGRYPVLLVGDSVIWGE